MVWRRLKVASYAVVLDGQRPLGGESQSQVQVCRWWLCGEHVPARSTEDRVGMVMEMERDKHYLGHTDIEKPSY